MTEQPRPPVMDLDPALIGKRLLLAVAAANALGHSRIASTLRDYTDDSPSANELQFVKDAITLPVEEVIEKWFGGRELADLLAQRAAFA